MNKKAKANVVQISIVISSYFILKGFGFEIRSWGFWITVIVVGIIGGYLGYRIKR